MSAAPAESAVRLPWLAPGAAALAALARGDPPLLDRSLRHDPGFALLWLRTGSGDLSQDGARAAMLRFALDRLAAVPAGRLNPDSPIVRKTLHFARRCAEAALQCAVASNYDRPVRAAVAGLLTPFGWLALAAIDPDLAESCRADPDHVHDPDTVEERWWGLSAATLTRRLARQWNLPVWIASAIGNLDLPASWAIEIGGDPALTTAVRDGLAQVARTGDPLGIARNLTRGGHPSSEFAETESLEDPYASPFLRDLLAFAHERLVAGDRTAVRGLELENDALRQALRSECAGFADRLKTEKLTALAEFAAGAGHEINNPLAVISGQAQYLLIKETEPDREKALHTVVQQAQRIHAILTDLMQFARPARPQKRPLDIRDAAGAVATNLHEFAALQRVRIELLTPDDPCPVEADPKQLQNALASLLRNAIEAAPEDGWARVTVEAARGCMQVIVEDSGCGPTEAQVEHLFDPFYSGRIAGRGRGLGLPTAWRLAREQGGDVTFDPRTDSPARFVLSLPHAEGSPAVERKSA